jgi:hypothetical protein
LGIAWVGVAVQVLCLVKVSTVDTPVGVLEDGLMGHAPFMPAYGLS